MNKNIKRAGIVGGVIGAVVAGGVAFAAFTSSGTFMAGGNVSSGAQPLTATSGTITELFPGDCSDVTVTFHNPNKQPATIDLSKGSAALGSLTATLNGSASSLLAVNKTGTGNFPALGGSADPNTLIAPAGGDITGTVTNLLCLSSTATDAIKGQHVVLSGTVPFTVAGTEYKG